MRRSRYTETTTTMNVRGCVLNTWRKRDQKVQKTLKGVCDYSLLPTSFQYNTAREMRIKAQGFSLPWSISIFLCGSILSHTHTRPQTHTHKSNPSIPLLYHLHLPDSDVWEVFLAFLSQSSSFYFNSDPWPLSFSFRPSPSSLLINTLITFSFRSTDFNTYYYGPIRYCSLHPNVWEHYYFIWSPKGSKHTHSQAHIDTDRKDFSVNRVNQDPAEKPHCYSFPLPLWIVGMQNITSMSIVNTLTYLGKMLLRSIFNYRSCWDLTSVSESEWPKLLE